jgi:protein-disulfide isomerase
METVASMTKNSPVSSMRHRARMALGSLAAIALLAGCRDTTPTQKPVVQQGAAVSEVPDVLATIGDQKITMADLRERAGNTLAMVETQYQTVRSSIIQATLDSILRERVLGAEAKKEGKSLEELIAKSHSSVAEPTDSDVQNWYNANLERTSGRTFDQVKTQIRDYLRTQRQSAAIDSLRVRLDAEQKVAVQFQPYRLTFDNAAAPTVGKENAPITLVEFSDFQCPYCRGFAPNLKLIEKNFGDQVRIVYRQDPIPSLHPFAFKAAEASLCAQEQGKFWEMHDTMFGDQTKLAVADLKQTARKLGMDGKKFDSCLDTGKYVEHVQKDMAEAQRVGVKGTPAIFVNGTEIKGGAVPYDVVAHTIQKELAQTKTSR